MAYPSSSSACSAASAGLAGGDAGVFPWDWRPAAPSVAASQVALLRLRGPDSLRFLHGQTSQAIELARPGQWLSTCCITPTARMRALAEVLVTDDGAWLVIREGDGGAVRQALDRVLFPADAVELGPLGAGLLLEPVPGASDDTEATTSTSPPLASDASLPSGSGWRSLKGGEGFWLGESLLLQDPEACVADRLEPGAQALLARPHLEGEARERWRIQLGWPACPAELNDDTNPFELGLADRVSLGKGCYVGQETLARLATYDGVKRQLRRWFVAGSEGVGVGAPLSFEGERAGVITSAFALPGGAGWIGLALVRRAALEAVSLAVEREDHEPLRLWLSLPDQFVAPPVGAGGAGRTGG